MGSDPEVVQITTLIVENIKVTRVKALHVIKKMEVSNDMLEKGVGNSSRGRPNSKKGLITSGVKTLMH